MLTKNTFQFLRDLKTHNDRKWFEAHRESFETHVKRPMLELLEELAPGFGSVSRHIVVDPRPVGGSLMRIHRDIRFSKDKTPYKTHMAAMLAHSSGKDSSAPAFYLHVEPGATLFGGGVWHPDSTALKKVRDRIARDPAGWRKATAPVTEEKPWELIGSSLKRPPAGYDPAHPFIEDLKRKDFGAAVRFTDPQVLTPKFTDSIVAAAKRMMPFMMFLAKAIESPF